MGRPYDVLVVGELNVDIIVRGNDVTPAFGQTEKLVDDLSVCAGSSAAIFASAASKMGLKVLFVSRVGDDLFGRFMISTLRDAGIDTCHVTVDPTLKTGASVALSHGTDRAMLTYLGSISAVSGADLCDDYYNMARHLHVASPFLLSGLRASMPQMMDQAKTAGMSISLDTNWDPEAKWQVDDLIARADILLPNEQELQAFTQCQQLEKAMAQMRSRVPILVVKRGASGATAFEGAQRHDVSAMPVDVADTTGAGDSFDGGFIAGWLRGESLPMCLQLGMICGSLTATIPGGFNGQPTWRQAVEYPK